MSRPLSQSPGLNADPNSLLKEHKKWSRILVPASGRPFSRRSVDIACRLAKSSGATVYLVYILEVSRTFELDASLPEEEGAANTALKTAAAFTPSYKINPISRVHRVRGTREGILAFIGEQEIDLLILGSQPDEATGLPRQLARDLFMIAPCEVVVDYAGGGSDGEEAGDDME